MNALADLAPTVGEAIAALSMDQVPCPDCKGRGYFWSDGGPAPRRDDCDWCGGSGMVFEEVEI